MRREPWKATIDVSHAWNPDEPDNFRRVAASAAKQIPQVAKIVGQQDDVEIEEICWQIETLETDPHADVEEFNDLWDSLYDWCDDHRVWVKTL